MQRLLITSAFIKDPRGLLWKRSESMGSWRWLWLMNVPVFPCSAVPFLFLWFVLTAISWFHYISRTPFFRRKRPPPGARKISLSWNWTLQTFFVVFIILNPFYPSFLLILSPQILCFEGNLKKRNLVRWPAASYILKWSLAGEAFKLVKLLFVCLG